MSNFEFVKLQNLPIKQKCLNFGAKMPYLGFFGLYIEKTIVIFETAPSNLSNCKISPKNKSA